MSTKIRLNNNLFSASIRLENDLKKILKLQNFDQIISERGDKRKGKSDASS